MIELPKKSWEIVKKILRKHLPGVRVCAFGSRVTGRAKQFSDLDLVVMGDSPIPQTTMYQITDAFEESDLPIRVDVVDWHRIDKNFQKIIQSQCEEISS